MPILLPVASEANIDYSFAPMRLNFSVAGEHSVSAVWTAPDLAMASFVFAHGAGAGMDHPFMADMSEALAQRRMAVLRYQFPYMERGDRRPDRPPLAQATVTAAVATARERLPDVPMFAGGKSFGGRMTSQAAAAGLLGDVRGLVFLGFPLHPAKKPAAVRADHLSQVHVPMLFVQGTRDGLADLALLTPTVHALPQATLHRVEGGDHSFAMSARAGRSRAEVLGEIADTVARWCGERV